MSRSRVPALDGSPAAIHAIGWGWRHAGRAAWAVRHLDLHVDEPRDAAEKAVGDIDPDGTLHG